MGHPCLSGAQALVEKEPLLGGYLYATILNQPTFERALAYLIATKLSTTTILASQWNDLIIDAISSTSATPGESHPPPGTGSIADAARADLEAIKTRWGGAG